MELFLSLVQSSRYPWLNPRLKVFMFYSVVVLIKRKLTFYWFYRPFSMMSYNKKSKYQFQISKENTYVFLWSFLQVFFCVFLFCY